MTLHILVFKIGHLKSLQKVETDHFKILIYVYVHKLLIHYSNLYTQQFLTNSNSFTSKIFNRKKCGKILKIDIVIRKYFTRTEMQEYEYENNWV